MKFVDQSFFAPRTPVPTKELLSKQTPVVGVKAGALVSDRNHELSRLKVAAYVDGRFRRRIFRRIVENLAQCSLHQYRIYPQQNEFFPEALPQRQAATPALKRSVDEVGRFGPFELRLQAVAADVRSVGNILEFDIEPLRFPMHQRRKLFSGEHCR